jgi:hypothetical protein
LGDLCVVLGLAAELREEPIDGLDDVLRRTMVSRERNIVWK